MTLAAEQQSTLAPPARTSRFLPRVGATLVLILVPLMLLALPFPPLKGKYADIKQDWVLGGAILVAIAAGVAYFVPSPLFPQKRSALPLILFGTATLLTANIIWNRAFLDYTRGPESPRNEVFRRAMRNFHAPVYGRYDNALARSKDAAGPPYDHSTVPFVVISAGIAAAWYAWARRRPLDRPWDAKGFAILAALQLSLIFFFAMCEPWPTRLSLNISGYSEFKKDIPAFAGVGDTLRTYVAKMPKLEWYGQHYPPGNLLLLTIEKQLGIPGMTKSIVCLLTVLTALPLYKLARELELDDVATSTALLLFTATTGVLVYATINTTSLVLFPGTVCLWTLIRALRTGSPTHAALCGLSFAFYLFFSFSGSILGVLMALTTLLGLVLGAFPIKNAFRTGAIAVACVFAVVVLLYATTKFNLIACFITAVRGHQTQQGNEGFDDVKRWLLRSTGNIIAYLMSIVPLSILIVGAIGRSNRTKWQAAPATAPAARAMFIAVALTALFAGFSGLFYVETERIWIFLTPCFALAAGYELSRRSELEGRRVIWLTFLLVLIVSCTQEFFFQHYR